MSDNNENLQSDNDTTILNDIQCLLREMLSSVEQQQQQQQHRNGTILHKKNPKCHGNSKLQHFKRKWRARGLNEEDIIKLFFSRNHTNPEALGIQYMANHPINKSHKRKRNSSKSMNQFSISEHPSKRIKNSALQITSSNNRQKDSLNDDTNVFFYKPSKYLKMPKKLLLHSLRLQLNMSMKRKKERHFILLRLMLLDKQFYLDEVFSLNQIYLDLASKHQIWPNDILHNWLSNHENFNLMQLEKHMLLLKRKIDQNIIALLNQEAARPANLPEQQIIDMRLKEFVHLHHIDLLRRIRYEKQNLKDTIYERRLRHQLSLYRLNDRENEIISLILDIRAIEMKIFENLTMFEQRILCRTLPKSFDDISIPTYQTLFGNNANKMVQSIKRQKLFEQLEKYEIDLQNYEEIYQTQIKNLESTIINMNLHDRNTLPDIVILLLKELLDHYTKQLMHQIRYKEACLHVKLVRQHHRRLSSKQQIIDVYPQIIIDVPKVSLNRIQLDYLSRTGPNYIRPNQSYLYSNKHRQKQMKQEHESIMDTIIPYLVRIHHIPHTATIIKQFTQQLKTHLQQKYATPLSYLSIYRCQKELKLLKSIQYRLKKENYIIQVTDKSGIFHIGHASDYEKKAEAYRQKTGAYVELDSDPLLDVFQKVVHLLIDLRSKKHILAWQLDKMMPKREKTQLAYLYFIPKPHKPGTPLRPIVSSMNTPTTGVSKFLDKLIRPLFDKHAHSTSIIDGMDLINRLRAYETNGFLKPTTYFCTFDITDLYTMLPQDESLDILTEFLTQYGYRKIQNIPIDAIRKLARIVIKENVFTYKNKFYRQTIGGAMGSAFTLTLANIFMWKWEKELVNRLRSSNEIYVRYIDDIFFTSNECYESIDKMLDEVNCFHPNIKLVRCIARNMPFLDIFIQNTNGVLNTSVYHKSTTEPYIVPFHSDHPRHIFKNIINTALLRAVRYSTDFFKFNNECRTLKLMLLYNEYPPNFIYQQFQKFFAFYLKRAFIQTIFIAQKDLHQIRSKLMNLRTNSTSVYPSSIALDEKKSESPNTNALTLCTPQLNSNHRDPEPKIHPKFESRFKDCAKNVHHLWDSTFLSTQMIHNNIMVAASLNKQLRTELISN